MKRSSWRFFPWAVVAGLGFVVLVNAGMVYAALHSFPGQAGDEGFALSNHYDAVLERERRDTMLGWTMVAQTDDAGRAEVRLTYSEGLPLRGASLAGTARRPLGAPETRSVAFHEVADGRYVTDAVLPAAGQWELTLLASFAGHEVAVTRRVIVH